MNCPQISLLILSNFKRIKTKGFLLILGEIEINYSHKFACDDPLQWNILLNISFKISVVSTRCGLPSARSHSYC